MRDINNIDSFQFDRAEAVHRMIVKEGLIDDMLDCMSSVLYSLGGRYRCLESSKPDKMAFDWFSLDDINASLCVHARALKNLEDKFNRIMEESKNFRDCEFQISHQPQRDLNEEEIKIYDTYCKELTIKIQELEFLIEKRHTYKNRYTRPDMEVERTIIYKKKHNDLWLLKETLFILSFWVDITKIGEDNIDYYDQYYNNFYSRLWDIIQAMDRKIVNLKNNITVIGEVCE